MKNPKCYPVIRKTVEIIWLQLSAQCCFLHRLKCELFWVAGISKRCDASLGVEQRGLGLSLGLELRSLVTFAAA